MRSKTWNIPVLIALLSVIGLVSALVADGVWDALSWFGLGIPVAACSWYALRSPGHPQQEGN